MNTNCAIHFNSPAAFNCSECGKPSCLACENSIAGKQVCSSCVSAIQQRIRATSSVPPIASQPSPAYAQAGGNLLLGAVAGMVAGIIGAFVWDKFVIITHIQFGLIASGIGYAVGYAVVKAGKMQGTIPAIMSAAIALFAMILGHVLLVKDVVAGQGLSIPFGLLMQNAFKTMEVFDYVFIAIGVWGAWSTGMHGSNRR